MGWHRVAGTVEAQFDPRSVHKIEVRLEHTQIYFAAHPFRAFDFINCHNFKIQDVNLVNGPRTDRVGLVERSRTRPRTLLAGGWLPDHRFTSCILKQDDPSTSSTKNHKMIGKQSRAARPEIRIPCVRVLWTMSRIRVATALTSAAPTTRVTCANDAGGNQHHSL